MNANGCPSKHSFQPKQNLKDPCCWHAILSLCIYSLPGKHKGLRHDLHVLHHVMLASFVLTYRLYLDYFIYASRPTSCCLPFNLYILKEIHWSRVYETLHNFQYTFCQPHFIIIAVLSVRRLYITK